MIIKYVPTYLVIIYEQVFKKGCQHNRPKLACVRGRIFVGDFKVTEKPKQCHTPVAYLFIVYKLNYIFFKQLMKKYLADLLL